MEASGAVLESARAIAFPLAALSLGLYPVVILIWTVAEGSSAGRAARAKAEELMDGAAALKCAGGAEAKKFRRPSSSSSCRWGILAVVAAVLGLLRAAQSSLGFLGSGAAARLAASAAPPAAASQPDLRMPGASAQGAAGGRAAAGAAIAACFAGVAVALRGRRAMLRPPAGGRAPRGERAGVVLRLHGEAQSLAKGAHPARAAAVYSAPPHQGISLWHEVDLVVKTWLDEGTDTLRYVNEIPLGCLQKFEVMPHLPGNRIEEDPKGSSRLAAFGVPVPFNYGCFPQTYRDPQELDELHGAPGDDDPLDVLDLCAEAVGVGEVVRCRPLGAVCLIDEGQADWKVLAVNVDAADPLAEARSIQDVERIAPGRIQECLQWIDDFKQSSGKGEAKLHFEVHDAQRARAIIRQDHRSWEALLQEARVDGTARGHWIRPAARAKASRPIALKLGWAAPPVPRPAVPGRMVEEPGTLVGAGLAENAARSRTRRALMTQTHASDHETQTHASDALDGTMSV